jgi:DNA (cytosine-5)-methyltransferase 1
VPGGVVRRLYHELEALGYGCRAALLNAADYGCFQRRVRCFIVGSRVGAVPEFPSPTHQKPGGNGTLDFCPPWRTLGEFLAQFADSEAENYVYPTPALAADLAGLPDGAGLKSRGVAEPTRPSGHWGYRQGTFIADQTLPARTVTGSAAQDWVRWQGRLRRLTLLEVKRLQGFPDDWAFAGNKSAVFKQVGNAVPTVFGEALGRLLVDHLRSPGRAPPRALPFPTSFEGYIAYTNRDHQRNASARSIHRKFAPDRQG